MIDLAMLGLLALTVWLVSRDGPHGAGITLLSLIIGGLIAVNFFEPLANFLSNNVQISPEWTVRYDIIAFWVLLAGSVQLLRMLGEKLFPTFAEMIGPIHQGATWGLSLLVAYVFIGLVFFSLHIAPLPREFHGFSPESPNLFGLKPDRQWLGFAQHASERLLSRSRADGRPAIFDGAEFPANPDDRNTMQVWSSLPIRYGTRRQLYASGNVGGIASPAALPASSSAPSTATPKASPNAGTGGF